MNLKHLPKLITGFLPVLLVLSFADTSLAVPGFSKSISVDSTNMNDPYQFGKRVSLSSGTILVENGSLTLWYTAHNGNVIQVGTFKTGKYDGVQTGALIVTFASVPQTGRVTLYYN